MTETIWSSRRAARSMTTQHPPRQTPNHLHPNLPAPLLQSRSLQQEKVNQLLGLRLKSL